MTIKHVRLLRKRLPPAEARLWNALKRAPFKNCHFRRQVPIGPYSAGFASRAAKLVIEIEVETHGEKSAQAYDNWRDWFIHREGFDTLRVTNRDVMKNLGGVLIKVSQRLRVNSGPLVGPPSPQDGPETSTVDQEKRGA